MTVVEYGTFEQFLWAVFLLGEFPGVDAPRLNNCRSFFVSSVATTECSTRPSIKSNYSHCNNSIFFLEKATSK